MELAFENLRESSPQMRKTAVHIIWLVLFKYTHCSSDIISNDELIRLFNIQKLQLVRLCQPVIHFAKPEQPDETLMQ